MRRVPLFAAPPPADAYLYAMDTTHNRPGRIRREHLQLAVLLTPTFLVAAALVFTLASPPSGVAASAAAQEVHGVAQLVALDTETGPLLAVRN